MYTRLIIRNKFEPGCCGSNDILHAFNFISNFKKNKPVPNMNLCVIFYDNYKHHDKHDYIMKIHITQKKKKCKM